MRGAPKIVCALALLSVAACAGIFGIDDITYVDPNAPDASADGDVVGDGGDGGLQQPNLPGAVLWLDGRSGVNAPKGVPIVKLPEDGVPVTSWRDNTLRGNDVRTQLTSVTTPRFVLKGINNSPAVDFSPVGGGTGANLVTPISPDFQFGTSDYCIVVVAAYQPNATDDAGTFVSEGAENAANVGFSLRATPGVELSFNAPSFDGGDADVPFDLGAGSSNVYDDDKPHVIGLRRYTTAGVDHATLEMRVDGQAVATYSSAPLFDESPGKPIAVGSLDAFPLRGLVAQVVVVSGPFANADLENLEDYFGQVYAITIVR